MIPVLLSNLHEICASFSDEQMTKLKNRKRPVRKQKADTSRNIELDLLGDEGVDSYTGPQADLEAEQLFASPPRPQPLRFESLSLKTPAKTVPPTSVTALQQKIESLKNPWVLTLTSNNNNKWVYSRLPCLRQ